MKIIEAIERGAVAVERFFSNLSVIQRLASAFQKGTQAFNDELFRNDAKRQKEIAERNKKTEVSE